MEIKNRQYDITIASERTVCWLLEDPVYTKWQHSPKGLLWIRGKPGSGKSTLLKFALAREITAQEQEGFVLMSFFFDGRGAQLQHSLLGFFQSLLYQVVTQVDSLSSRFVEHCRSKKASEREPGKGLEWNLNELRNLPSSYIHHAIQINHVKIYIDALDECGEAAAIELASYLHTLIPKPSTVERIHICITCRHYPIIEPLAPSQIIMEARNINAIATHISETFENLSAILRSDEMIAVEQEILERASGVFQWVVLMLKVAISLRNNGQHPRMIRKRMRDLPTGLDDLYSSMLQEIGMQDQCKASKLMRWVCFAERPLSLSEIRLAIAFDTEEPYPSLQAWEDSADFMESDEQMVLLVTSLSGGLVESVTYEADSSDLTLQLVGDGTSELKVQFIYESVNDYIRSHGLSAIGSYSPSDIIGHSHFRMVKACINYVKTDELRKLVDKAEGKESLYYITHDVWEPPFFQYALLYWWQHLERAEGELESLEEIIVWLGYPSDRILQIAVSLLSLTQGPWKRQSIFARPFGELQLLHVMCCVNIMSVVRALIERYGAPVNLKDSMGNTPLTIAVMYGHEMLAKYLLSRANVEINSQNRKGETALHISILYQHMIASGRESLTDIRELSRLVAPYGATQETIASGGNAMMLLLSHPGIDVHVKDTNGWTASMFAVRCGNESAVRHLLIREELDIKSSSNGPTAVKLAAAVAEAKMRNFLLSHQIISENIPSHIPLMIAIIKSDAQTAQYLILNGAINLNLMDVKGQTALHYTVKYGSEEILGMLLARSNVDVNAKDDWGLTPLMIASRRAKGRMMNMLLGHTAINVNVPDANGKTVLHHAASDAHTTHVEQLLNFHEVNILARDSQSMTALQQCVRTECTRILIVKMLLMAGFFRHAPREYFSEAFELALRLKRTPIIRLMLEQYPHISRRRYRSKFPHTALHGWRGQLAVMGEDDEFIGGDAASDGDLACDDNDLVDENDAASEGDVSDERHANIVGGA